MFGPNETETMVWPSVEVARGLLDNLFGLPNFERKKKETTLESYMKEKTKRIHEKLERTQEKNNEYEMDQLMVQLDGDLGLVDLNLNGIYELLYFSKDKIMNMRRKLDFMQHLPLPEPPMNPFEAQRIIDICTLSETHGHYLMDQWVFPSPKLPNSQIVQKIEMASYNQNPNPRCYLPYQRSYHPYQGSSINVNLNLEMQPIGPPVMTFHGMIGSVSPTLQNNHNMNNSPIMTMSQPKQYPIDFMIREQRTNINIGGSHFHWSSMTTNYSLCQKPPPDEATFEESNADAAPFDVNKGFSGFNNNHHF